MSRAWAKVDDRRRPALPIVLAAAALVVGLSSSYAQDATVSSEANAGHQQAVTPEASQPGPAKAASSFSKPYYIEFRARSAQSYGHTFSIHGRLNGGKIVTKTVSGLHPFTESAVPWMVGHLVMVPSETGASDGDTEDQYVTARFRVTLSQDEYKKVMAFIKDLEKKSPLWHAVLYNCNAYVGDIARFMGLETPQSTMLMPAEYINELRDMNISRSNAKMIGTPVKVEDAAKLRAEALKTLARHEKPATVAQHRTPDAKSESSVTSPAPASSRHKSTTPVSSAKPESQREMTRFVRDDMSRPTLTPTSN